MRTVLIKGKPFALVGPELKVGQTAPRFTLKQSTSAGVVDRSLEEYQGKALILSVVPSLDTGTCALMARRFAEEAAKLPDDVKVLTVSADLPYAQSRFCQAEGADAMEFASDHMDVAFGKAYGVLIPERRYLARSVFVVSPTGELAYVEYVPDITELPDFEAAISAAKALA
jgi:thiol peroxidase